MKTLRHSPTIILLVGVVFQLALLVRHDWGWQARLVWRSRGDEAWKRSVQLGFGADVSEYVEFLRRMVPEDVLVVIPPFGHDVTFGNMGLMQYFLFPRRLTNCPSLEEWASCRDQYDGGRTYIVSIGDFPPRAELPSSMIYHAFDSRLGLLSPTPDNAP